MSVVKTVLGAMKYDVAYDLESIKAATRLPESSIKQALSMLVRGGVVEHSGDRYVKDREYKSKQRSLL